MLANAGARASAPDEPAVVVLRDRGSGRDRFLERHRHADQEQAIVEAIGPDKERARLLMFQPAVYECVAPSRGGVRKRDKAL